MKTLAPTKLPRSSRRARPASASPRHESGNSDRSVRSLKPRGTVWTDTELLALGAGTDVKYELHNGKVVAMPPAGFNHGVIISRLMAYLGIHVLQHKLGELTDGQSGFRISIENCFEPDIAFVSHERIKLVRPLGEKLFHGSPDLAIEVLSPSDSITRTERRLLLFLNHGSRLAWMIDPKSKTARVYRPGQDFELLKANQTLTGNSVVPGFRLSLARIFEGL
jgi:Uma2 family endonuclease